MPGGEVTIVGSALSADSADLPRATIGDTAAFTTLSRSSRLTIEVPEGCISGDIVLHHAGGDSNPLYLHVAVPMAENLHPVSNPAVDADGNVFATVSGPRGQQVPVSVFRIERDFQMRPFIRDLLNATGLAFGPDRYLYISSRAEGTVYRASPEGAVSLFAEGLGLATGLAFDAEGNLFVGDRSGTIFKIPYDRGGTRTHTDREIFVFATLEPSMAAYHLAFSGDGTLFVCGPTTSSSQIIHRINRDGTVTPFFKGLGRAQGMAFSAAGDLYVAASASRHPASHRSPSPAQTSSALPSSTMAVPPSPRATPCSTSISKSKVGRSSKRRSSNPQTNS